MNRETIERWILLDQSGELGPLRRRLLQRHLAQHPELRSFRSDIDAITNTMRSLEAEGPSPNVLAAINIAAREAREPAATWSWRPALAFAGALALVVVSVLLVFRSGPSQPAQVATPVTKPAATTDTELAWDNGIDSDLKQLDTQLAMVTRDDDTTVQQTTSESSDDIESIASELLKLEGSKI